MKIITTLLLSTLCVFAFAPAMPQNQIAVKHTVPEKSEHINLIQDLDSIANRIKLTNSNIIKSLNKIEHAKYKKHLDNNFGIGNGITLRANPRN